VIFYQAIVLLNVGLTTKISAKVKLPGLDRAYIMETKAPLLVST
jgi:hypothetical protein